MKAQDGPAQRGFPAAGLPDNAQCAPGLNLKVDAVHRVEPAPGRLEILFQVLGFDQHAHSDTSCPDSPV